MIRKWLGMKESNLHIPGQNRSRYHYANPQYSSRNDPDLTPHSLSVKPTIAIKDDAGKWMGW